MQTTASNAEPETGLPLECLIETQAEHQFGKPIAVKGTLHNSGSSAIWILSWNTFLEPDWSDCVLVTHNGSSVPYTGIVAIRLAPTRESYLRIPAGGSLSREVDISEKYDITEAGDYEVSFRLPVLGAFEASDGEPPLNNSQYKLTFIESKKATFRIDGSVSTVARMKAETLNLSAQTIAAASFPSDPVVPICQGMTPDETRNFQDAHRRAYRHILDALKSVQGSIQTPMYQAWFDCPLPQGSRLPGWEERRQKVIDCFTNMAQWMSNPKTQVIYKKTDEECGDLLRVAWTRVGAKGPINLCSRAFNDHTLRFLFWDSPDWARAFVLVHEISHAAGGTVDHWYNWLVVSALAFSNPSEAVTNAQNYAYFAMNRDSNVPPPSAPFGETITLQAADGMFLSAKQDGSLRADSREAARSERFVVVSARDYDVALKALATNKYVSVVDPDSGVLKANSSTIGWAEAFQWGGHDTHVSLRALTNGKVVGFRGSSPEPLALFDSGEFVYAVQNRIWAVSGLRLRRLNPATGAWENVDAFAPTLLSSIAFAQDDNMWYTNINTREVYTWNSKTGRNIEQGLLGGWSLRCLVFDAENTMWGIRAGRVHDGNDGKVGEWDASPPPGGWHDGGFRGGWRLMCIAFDLANTMWCVGQGGKVGKWDSKTRAWNDFGLLGGWKLQCIAFDTENTMWGVSQDSKIGRMKAEVGWEEPYPSERVDWIAFSR